MENKKYKCIKSHTGNEVGEIYDENYRPKWFKNFGSVSEFVKATPRWTDWFVEITPVIQQTRDMQKSNQEFKVGDYIFVMIKGKNFGDILKVTDSFIEKKSNYSGVWINHKPSSFGGGGFRLNGNGYIYGKDIRHATPEEINNHLISIGQIPAGEPLNTGIEPNKDGMFKYTTGNSCDKDFSTSIVPGPLKMTLSIDDEELPMVNIIKTNSIKQLLNND